MVDKSRFYVDVNVFVYWLGNHPKYGQAALEWVKKMETSAGRICYVSFNAL